MNSLSIWKNGKLLKITNPSNFLTHHTAYLNYEKYLFGFPWPNPLKGGSNRVCVT